MNVNNKYLVSFDQIFIFWPACIFVVVGDEKFDVHFTCCSYLCTCQLHQSPYTQVTSNPTLTSMHICFYEYEAGLFLAKNDLRENILYEVVSSFMLPGVYCIIMTHKLRGGNSHNIPACNQSEFQVDNANNDHEEFAIGVFDISISHIDYRYINTFYRTQVSLGSDLWVLISLHTRLCCRLN